MASLVDTSVKHYLSTMYGAPVQTGLAGAKIAVLDACLVSGFGLRAVTRITVAAGIATVEFSAGAALPPPIESVQLIDGATQALLNGEQRVTDSGNGFFKFRTTAPDGIDAGAAITTKFAPLGWVKPFTGTNQAVYRSTDPQSNGMYLAVDDRNTLATSMRGYENMTAVDTGTGLFPTVVQRNDGLWWSKSTQANSNPVRWSLVGDSRMFYENVAPGTATSPINTGGGSRGFGDAIPLRPSGDAWATVISGATAASNASSASTMGAFEVQTTSPYFFMARAISGIGVAVAAAYRAFTGAGGGTSGSDTTLGSFPSEVDGELKLSRSYLDNLPAASPAPRAAAPGYRYVPQSGLPAVFERDTYVVENGTNRRLIAMPVSASAGTPSGIGFLDITGPWR